MLGFSLHFGGFNCIYVFFTLIFIAFSMKIYDAKNLCFLHFTNILSKQLSENA